MRKAADDRILTIPRFEGISWLIHGFGTGEWSEGDFAKNEEWRDFRLVLLDQVHSDTVHRLERPPERKLRGDALITEPDGSFPHDQDR